LKVGAGLGDDAEEPARRGLAVTACDVAPTAVEWAWRRLPESRVDCVVADAPAPPVRAASGSTWRGRTSGIEVWDRPRFNSTKPMGFVRARYARRHKPHRSGELARRSILPSSMPKLPRS
jgi:hypothetical protein